MLAKAATLCTAMACARVGPHGVGSAHDRWILVATRPNMYTLRLDGPAEHVASGVALSSKNASVGVFGQAEYSQLIAPGKARRVRVSAEVKPESIRGSASLWVRADRKGARSLSEYASIPARGSSDWQRQETGLVVPDSATAVTYGVVMNGPGTVLMRSLTVTLSDIPSAEAPLSRDAKRELDSALALAKAYALWRDTLSWPVIEVRVRQAANGARDVGDVYPALRLLTRSLGDAHSSFYTANDWKMFRSAANTPMIDVHLEERDIGYVYLSGYLAENFDSARAYTERMHAAIDRVAPAAECGWLIDLRGNNGGVPEPMLVALEPFISRDSLRSGDLAGIAAWFGKRSPIVRPALERAYVALLIGSQTGSAGERVTMMLRRRAHTRTFGSATAGATTRRAMYKLPDGAVIAIATAPMRDGAPRGREVIIPDETVMGGTGPGDPVLRAAARWVRANVCGGQAIHSGR